MTDSTQPVEAGAESPRIAVQTYEDLQAIALASQPQEDEDTPEPQGATDTATEAESSDPPADEQGDEEGDKPKPPPKGVQKRLDELTREKYEERRRADALQAQLERTIAMLDRQSGGEQQPQEQTVDTDGAPDPERYPEGENDRQYIRDLTRFEVRQEFAAQQARQEQQREITEIQAREQAARERYADYNEVVTGEALAPILKGNPQLIATLAKHEQGPDLAYYLATHPDEVQKLARIGHESALIRLGQLSIAIATPTEPPSEKAPKVSKAPAPITPIGAGGDPPSISFERKLADLEERGDFDAWRKLKSSAKR
jgi:hypothetical protein